jgi:antitoxin (DNA-binding transcriptional repressor) of toxin-antitoxin stability system
MLRTITLEQAAENLAGYVKDISRTGDSLVLTSEGNPVAELRPARRTARLSELRAVLEAGPRLNGEEAADFARDVAAGRVLMNTPLPSDPWES